jgi:hypothetical protein
MTRAVARDEAAIGRLSRHWRCCRTLAYDFAHIVR